MCSISPVYNRKISHVLRGSGKYVLYLISIKDIDRSPRA